MQHSKTAAQINEQKERIISLLLHDLKPPLQVLRFLTGHLSGGKVSAEMLHGYLEELNMAVEELVQSSAAIFTWLEVQRDKFLGTPQTVDVTTLLQEAVHQFSQEVPGHGATLRMPQLADMTITTDANAVHIVLQQLLHNAAAAQPGGIIQLDAWEENGLLWISVQDSGKGMSGQVIANITAHLAEDDTAHVLYRYGYRIIIKVLQLLQAQIRFDTHHGTRVSIGIPNRL